MLDIRFIKANQSAVKKDLEKRGDKEKVSWVAEVVGKHDEWKELKEKWEKLRHSRNAISQEINQLQKQGKSIAAKVKEVKELPQRIAAAEQKLQQVEQRIDFILRRLPNVLHESVPVGKDDTENKEARRWGQPKKPTFPLKSHGELLEQLGLADFERATKIAGAGFHFLKGDLVKLEFALINFAAAAMEKKGFTLIEPPLMMQRKPYEGVVAISDFENVMYKIDEGGNSSEKSKENEKKESSYLIATSEHPLAAMMMNETLDEKQLPLKFCGVSSCFRREIGSHGVDTRGLFRVHQFSKVEMFAFCKPEDSWKLHEELLKNAEELLQQLKIPYRVVNVCTGDIGMVAAKKYDLETWFPRQNAYREVVSCSNCTTYQATALNIRYNNKEAGEKEYVHTLNATAVATSRVMAAIVENFQNKDGTITVPDVLVPYFGKKVIGK
ncbi:serine--tRNA ligase [Candidatus Woesearchaeota archaeon]|nr:serine--tRNA ligase [Candidatus Woesearchaeota archaeon]